LKKFAVLFLIAYSCVCWTQQMSHRLNNQDIIDMVTLGISDDVIITKIHSAAKPESAATSSAASALPMAPWHSVPVTRSGYPGYRG